MQQSKRPMEVAKICLCGDPAAGKTTLKCTLTVSFVTVDGESTNEQPKINPLLSWK